MPDPADRLAAVRIERVGDAALLAVVGDEIDADLNAWVHRAAADVRLHSAPSALGAPVPGYASLLVAFDPEACSEDAARALLLATLGRTADGPPPAATHPIEIAVRYGGPDGPDLADVAARTGLTEEEVVVAHAG
ncbi:MAG: carboxyltransferase domain-containing protein, partial [Chloroflexota bacterium]